MAEQYIARRDVSFSLCLRLLLVLLRSLSLVSVPVVDRRHGDGVASIEDHERTGLGIGSCDA